MKNDTTNGLTLFSVDATMRDLGFSNGAVFIVAAENSDDAIECVREFLGDRFEDCTTGYPDPIGLAAGSGMRFEEIHRGMVVSSGI